ncbi:MAG TPA: hypothetical protein VHV82_11190 [Sporichthyaceae bacterium]|jgi:hypothetical protein|nr:hypothetical protein [Sporichthyaceae bacterium]
MANPGDPNSAAEGSPGPDASAEHLGVITSEAPYSPLLVKPMQDELVESGSGFKSLREGQQVDWG